MSNMEETLRVARDKRTNGDAKESSLNPTPETGSRYNKPIATAKEEGLPIIDISAFLDQNASPEARQTTAKAINAACVNYGFFYLTGHGIPTSKLDEIISLAREFFALPFEEKNKIKRFDAGGPEGGDGARGYQGLGENVTGGLQDMQEAIDWYSAWPQDRKEKGDGGPASVKTLQGENLWPEKPELLKDVYLEYIERVKHVGKALVHAMGVALDLGPASSSSSLSPTAPNSVEAEKEKDEDEDEDEEIFVRNCADSFWVMRMINYPPLHTRHTSASGTTDMDMDLSQFSCGAHTDYGCVTLLLADATPGALQVQLKDGSTWLNADPMPGAFVVNIGDMIERWTNGLWKSTLHRVIHRGHGARISVPFFYEPGFEAVVRPLRKCVRETGGVPIHAGSTYGEHLLTKVFNNFYYSKRTDW